MIKLNLLTGQQGVLTENSLEISEKEFWEYYLKLLDIRNTGYNLTPRESQVMVEVLLSDPNKSCFKGAIGKKIRKSLKIAASDYSKIKEKLILKDFLENTGAMRGDALAIPSIRKYQMYVKKALQENTLPEINYTFVFKIKQDAKSE